MNQRVEQGKSTRQHIVDTAARLFTEQGYDLVSTDMLLRASGISRGALYHHFASKDAVFVAVLEATEQRIVAQLTSAARAHDDPVAALRAGCAAWLALAAEDPIVRRLVLNDAPGVIGWQAWRALDERYTLGLIRAALTSIAAENKLCDVPVDVAAHILLAVLIEVALLVARSPADAAIGQSGAVAVDRVLAGLLTAKE